MTDVSQCSTYVKDHLRDLYADVCAAILAVERVLYSIVLIRQVNA
jgi:hypothetical protein